VDTQRKEKKMSKAKQKKLLTRILDRYEAMYDADQENRREALRDLKFVNVPGQQWDRNMRQERDTRPCYEFNKLRISCKRIINDMRANRPSAKIRAVEGGDKKTADINEGLFRNIWNVSDGNTIIDVASEYQVGGGMTAWRVTTEYSDDSAFDQDILVKGIKNPFTLYVDPSCNDQLKRDADDWLLTEKITFKEFETKYGEETEKSDFQDSIEFDDDENWQDEERVRVGEYWWKEPVKKTIWMMQFPGKDGQPGETKVVDSTSDEGEAIAKNPQLMALIQREREVMTDKIMYVVASGAEILEGPHEWAGPEFPFIMIFGESIFVDGRPYWWGLARFAKDAQRSYNIARTAISESIAQHSKSPYWATPDQAEGLTNQWAEAHKKNMPFQLYNPDPKAPGPPTRMGPADVPVALIQESQMASDEIKAVTGIFEASQGEQGNETSGRAIYARQQQGEIATFNYQDNMAKGIQRTAEIVLGLIPEVYDTERELRILGTDGSEDYVKVNEVVFDHELGKQIRVNDMSMGKYDVTITTGPNFSTLRQEAAETYGAMAQQYPEVMGIAGDLIFKSMDLPYADDIADRLKTMLPPQIQEMLNSDTEVPPEVQQMMQQAQQAMQQVQQFSQLVNEAADELEGDKAMNAKEKAEIKTELAKLKQAEAEFQAEIAEKMADLIVEKAGLTEKSANLLVKEAGLTVKGAEVKEAATAVAVDLPEMDANAFQIATTVDGILADFMKQADTALGHVYARTNRKPIGGTTVREGGRLTANVEYDDGSTESLSAVRDAGGLKIVPDSEG